jgi:hypothetical protein
VVDLVVVPIVVRAVQRELPDKVMQAVLAQSLKLAVHLAVAVAAEQVQSAVTLHTTADQVVLVELEQLLLYFQLQQQYL